MLTEKQFYHLAEQTCFDGNCLLWTGALSGRGYGQYLHKRVHVLFWEYMNGTKVPEGKELAHSCHRKLCLIHVRPKTHTENLQESDWKSDSCSKCGRLLEGGNLYVQPSRPSNRKCVWCRKRQQRLAYWRQKGLSKEEATSRADMEY